MAFVDCLAVALEGKEITKAQHDQLRNRYERLLKKHNIESGTLAAERAKKSLLDEVRGETREKKRRAKLAINAVKRLDAEAKAFRNASGKADVGTAFLYKLEHYGTAGFRSVAEVEKEVIATAQTRLTAMIQHFQRSFLKGDIDRLNKTRLPLVLREAFGEDTGDPLARSFAAAWLDTADYLRQRRNAAGGNTGKLEKWGMPQQHNPVALRARGKPLWKQDIKDGLDLSRMKHPHTGETITADEIDDILDGIFDSIVTDGWDTREPSAVPMGKGALASQRSEHRFLVFRDADAWLKYQSDYGGGSDIFSSMMSHIRGMAREIAAMEELGPNPNATVEWMRQVITREGNLKLAGEPGALPGKQQNADSTAKMRIKRLNEVWDTMRGNSGHPVNAMLARIGGGLRNWVTASVLGSTSLTAISDIGTSMVARRFAGIGGSAMKDYITAMTPAGRQDAMDMGIILDEAINAFHQEARFVGASDTFGRTAYLADRVLSVTGLQALTQNGKYAWGLGFGREFAKAAGRSWDGLDPALRNTMGRYGLTAADWEIMRSAPLHKGESGLILLRPSDIAKVNEKVAGRYLGMMQMESEYAVPTGGYRSRSALLGGSEAGTWQGEGIRSFAHLKGFGAAYVILHGARIARMVMGGQIATPMLYAGALLITSTFFGAISRQLTNVATGKDPEPMTSEAFWAAAMLKGGGLGIYGDFLFSETNRNGGGLASTIAGTLAERGGAALQIAGSTFALLTGQENNLGRELVNFARNNTPGGTIWYARLAYERLLLDQVQALVDPEANRAFKTKQRNAAKNFGQGHWWKPGQMTPGRMPDIGNATRPKEEAQLLAKP